MEVFENLSASSRPPKARLDPHSRAVAWIVVRGGGDRNPTLAGPLSEAQDDGSWTAAVYERI